MYGIFKTWTQATHCYAAALSKMPDGQIVPAFKLAEAIVGNSHLGSDLVVQFRQHGALISDGFMQWRLNRELLMNTGWVGK